MLMLTPRLRTAMHYGALSGIGSFLIFIAIYWKGSNPLGAASWLGAWIPVVFICISIKYFRDKLLGGFITYGQAFKTGLMTTVCASALFEFMVYIFGYFTHEAFLQAHIQEALMGLEQSKMFFNDELYAEMEKEIENLTMNKVVLNDFFTKMLGGVIVSLFAAAYYRRNPTADL
jgi:hypothetical protein